MVNKFKKKKSNSHSKRWTILSPRRTKPVKTGNNKQANSTTATKDSIVAEVAVSRRNNNNQTPSLSSNKESKEGMKTALASVPRKSNDIVPSIPLEDPTKNDPINVDKTVLVSFELRVSPKSLNTSTYTKSVRRFSEGNPSQWIRTIYDMKEIWSQNLIIDGEDRAAIVKTILRDDPLTVFEGALEAQLEPIEDDEESTKVNVEKVEQALKAVSASIFPHRALENQKQWMRRSMKKLPNMSYRVMQAQVMKMNRSLVLFPGANEESKFSSNEMLEILEFALPKSWRAKFDLKSYVPTQHTKSRLLIECEAIERSEAMESTKLHKTNPKEKDKDKKVSKHVAGKSDKGLKFCSQHGVNNTHDSAACWVINPKLKPAKFGTKPNAVKGKDMSAMLKQTSKKELFNMLMRSQITDRNGSDNKKKAVKSVAKNYKRKVGEDSSDESIHQMSEASEDVSTEGEVETPPPSDTEEPVKKRIKKLGKAEE